MPSKLKISNFPTLEDLDKELSKDPAYKEAYAALEPVFELNRKLLRMRFSAGLSQEEMAERMGMSLKTVRRLESADETYSPRLSTLERYAAAAGFKMELKFVPIDDGS